jgi:hypothetical protein
MKNINLMKEKLIRLLLATLVFSEVCSQTKEFIPYVYPHSTARIQEMYSGPHMENARRSVREMDSVILNGKYKANFESVSRHKTPEWYMDAKLCCGFP